MGLAVLLCVAVAVGGVVLVNRYIDNEVAKIPRIALTTGARRPNGVNFLIIGSDSRSLRRPTPGRPRGVQRQGHPERTAALRHDDGAPRQRGPELRGVVPRDLWVDIPGVGNAKINAAFNTGPQKVVDTLQSNFNVPINHYLEVNFETFEGIVNAIGTVPVYVPGVRALHGTGFYSPTAPAAIGSTARQRCSASGRGTSRSSTPKASTTRKPGNGGACSTPPPTSGGSSGSRIS